MINIDFAFRDERVNIFAMTKGLTNSKYTHQIILCKKNMLNSNRIGPFLLDPKRSNTAFELSIDGNQYSDYISNKKFELEYIAYIDSYIKFKVTIDMLDKICSHGFFNIWNPIAPYNYFEGIEYGYLVLFRVYKIKDKAPEYLLDKGRSGRNFYYNLGQSFITSLDNPVLDNEVFENMNLN